MSAGCPAPPFHAAAWLRAVGRGLRPGAQSFLHVGFLLPGRAARMYLVPTAATPSPTWPATSDPNEFIRRSVHRKYRISERRRCRGAGATPGAPPLPWASTTATSTCGTQRTGDDQPAPSAEEDLGGVGGRCRSGRYRAPRGPGRDRYERPELGRRPNGFRPPPEHQVNDGKVRRA